jgi:predicted amidohydrolase
MKEVATRLDIHLAGSILLLDHGEIYNALLLVAPDGKVWRYNKRYPWGWERAYFREGQGITIAHTELGDIGLMICWDAAHRSLWRQYAGKIDLLVISSCPPDVSNPTYLFSNGDRITFDDLGPIVRTMKGSAPRVFDEGINRQAAWLGVPVINTVACGQFNSAVPNGLGSLLLMAPFAPWIMKYASQAESMRITCGMTPGCKIIDAQGTVIRELTQEHGVGGLVAEINLPAEKPRPIGPQPAAVANWLTYFSSDVALPALMRDRYQRGVQAMPDRPLQRHGFTPQKWLIAIGAGALIGLLLAVFWPRRKS